MMSDCTVTIVFACFFVEATLNYIFEKLGVKDEFHGLHSKIAWFYNKYMACNKVTNKDLSIKLGDEFPGFSQIKNFRNAISHGQIY